MELSNYKPKEVIKYFEEICKIPHGSKNVEKISQYLVDFAKDKGLSYIQDDDLNVVIKKPATKGYESAEPVILQGHMDMVAIGDISEETGVDAYVEDGFITAKNSTLGADDGIAVAYMLALLEADDIPHPALECVFTTDEEIGMLGAISLDASILEGKTMINVDSEQEGVLTVGCAGGATIKCSFPFRQETFTAPIVEFKISNITGGHSGGEIHKQGANANVVMGRILLTLLQNMEIRILSINGGDKDNAIATFAEAAVVISQEEEAKTKALEIIENTFNEIKDEYSFTDPNMKLEKNYLDMSLVNVVSGAATLTTIVALSQFDNGVIKMEPSMKDMVRTSQNLGIVRTLDNSIDIEILVRSSVESEKNYQVEKIKALAEIFGGVVTVENDYPGWKYKEESRLREVFVDCYKELYKDADDSLKEPVVETVHAGLECGIFTGKIEGLDVVSIGPQMYDIHTVDERIEIASIERTWELLKAVLKKLK